MRFTADGPGEPPLESVIVARVAAPYAGPGGTLRQRSRYNVAFAELPCPYLIALYARNDYSPDILAATRAVGGGVGLGFYRCLCRVLVEQFPATSARRRTARPDPGFNRANAAGGNRGLTN